MYSSGWSVRQLSGLVVMYFIRVLWNFSETAPTWQAGDIFELTGSGARGKRCLYLKIKTWYVWNLLNETYWTKTHAVCKKTKKILNHHEPFTITYFSLLGRGAERQASITLLSTYKNTCFYIYIMTTILYIWNCNIDE